jgi:hypothetical protein
MTRTRFDPVAEESWLPAQRTRVRILAAAANFPCDPGFNFNESHGGQLESIYLSGLMEHNVSSIVLSPP